MKKFVKCKLNCQVGACEIKEGNYYELITTFNHQGMKTGVGIVIDSHNEFGTFDSSFFE